MKKIFFPICAVLAAVAFSLSMVSCSNNDDNEPEETNLVKDYITDKGDGTLFVVNEGSFQTSTASLSVYNPETNQTLNEAFNKVNGMKLGDGGQSMTIAGGKGWIVVNNSNVVFAVDPYTLKEKGRVTGLTSPRYFHQVNDKKAYVTQMYDNRIAVVDPSTYSVTGYIEVPEMEVATGSTEQMVAYGDYVYCNCWSYQKNIIKIDTRSDKVVETLEVGIQPKAIALDCNDKLWVLCDGGSWSGNPIGYEEPTLLKIDAKSFKIEQTLTFPLGDSVSELCLNGKKDTLYWINGDIWTMNVNSQTLPSESLIKSNGTYYYGLTVGPKTGEVYVADAIDYQQNGEIYRYSSTGNRIAQFSVGIIPGAFCWLK